VEARAHHCNLAGGAHILLTTQLKGTPIHQAPSAVIDKIRPIGSIGSIRSRLRDERNDVVESANFHIYTQSLELNCSR